MDTRHEYHHALGLSKATFERIEDEFVTRYYEGVEYRSLPDYQKRLEKGTVLLGGTVVRGFPKIPRTLVLEAGIPRYFAGEFAVEEKMNGYNVRVTRIDGDLYAFTRGGIVCPYTTWKVGVDLDLGPFFDEYPGTALCGEMVGPENPYTPHEYEEIDSLAFRAFRSPYSGTPNSSPPSISRRMIASVGTNVAPVSSKRSRHSSSM